MKRFLTTLMLVMIQPLATFGAGHITTEEYLKTIGIPYPQDIKFHFGQTYIEDLLVKGIVTGYQDLTFKPNRAVSVSEFSSMLEKAFDYKIPHAIHTKIERYEAVSYLIEALDVDVYPYFHTFFYDLEKHEKPAIETAFRLNLINGKGSGIFDPHGTLTRAEAAKIVSRALAIKPNNAPDLRPLILKSYSSWQK